MSLDPFISDFLRVIREGRFDNTYKPVWAMAIVDAASADPNRTNISLLEIGERVLPYFWNLHIFFDPEGRTLREGSNPAKPPAILQLALAKIHAYRQLKGNAYEPKLLEQLKRKELELLGIDYRQVASILKKDVSHRFQAWRGHQVRLYGYSKGEEQITLKPGDARRIADHADVLREAAMFRRVLILEEFNRTTPRIAAKVRMRRGESPRRRSLSQFRAWLDIENPRRVCSICGQAVASVEDLSIDHVIPWSFLFSDDLWNLVYAHQSCNLAKSSVPPSRAEVDRLQNRNKEFLRLLELEHPDLLQQKHGKELRFAVEEDLIQRMWTIYSGLSGEGHYV